MTHLALISPVVEWAKRHSRRIVVALVIAVMAGFGGIGHVAPSLNIAPIAAHAQTPVPLTIDTNSLLTQVNTWTASLDDVVFLGVAISIAIALLTFIGAQILKAFRGGGG